MGQFHLRAVNKNDYIWEDTGHSLNYLQLRNKVQILSKCRQNVKIVTYVDKDLVTGKTLNMHFGC